MMATESRQIVDTHTHFYDPHRPEGVPWPNKSEPILYRTVLPEHFREVAAPSGIRHTVIVEASNRLDDNAWVLDLGEADESIVGVVGYIDPASDTFADSLSRFASRPLFRGIRARAIDVAALAHGPCIGNLAALAELDLSMDLLARPEDLTAVTRLAEALPTLRIVLDHVAHVPVDGAEPAAEWLAGIRAVAEHHNVFCKVSGLVEASVERPAPTDPAFYEPTLTALFDELGADRLMYASNWPVCELASDYGTTYAIVDAFLRSRPAEEREAVEWKTAKAVYKYLVVNQ